MQETIPEATAEFLTLFDPEESVAKRNITGGTGFAQVAKQLEFWKKNLD
jgi:argininosuccinate lyase